MSVGSAASAGSALSAASFGSVLSAAESRAILGKPAPEAALQAAGVILVAAGLAVALAGRR